MDEESRQPHLPILSVVVETAVKLREDGHKVVIVSSGAIGVGMRQMDIDKRPKRLASLQVSDDQDPQGSPSPSPRPHPHFPRLEAGKIHYDCTGRF